MNVIFLGNHTVGVRALQALLTEANVVGVVAHPPDPEDGIKYESVYDFALSANLPVIRGTGKSQDTFEFISKLKPDLLWISDYRYILPDKIIGIPPLGTINIHPSLLPKYRGRAPINWALINGEKEFGLSVHYVDSDVDTGDLLEQTRISIAEDDYIGDLLEKCYPLYYSTTKKVVNILGQGRQVRQPQSEKLPAFPKRIADDGKINWNDSVKKIYNLVRAVSHPYPGAFSYLNEKKIYIWKALASETDLYREFPNGKVLSIDASSFKVKAEGGYLEVNDFSCIPDCLLNLQPGDTFSTDQILSTSNSHNK